MVVKLKIYKPLPYPFWSLVRDQHCFIFFRSPRKFSMQSCNRPFLSETTYLNIFMWSIWTEFSILEQLEERQPGAGALARVCQVQENRQNLGPNFLQRLQTAGHQVYQIFIWGSFCQLLRRWFWDASEGEYKTDYELFHPVE